MKKMNVECADGIRVDIPEAEPVRNPELKKAMALAKEQPSAEHSVEMFNQVVRAAFVIPVEMDRSPEYDKETGEIIFDKDTEIRFELIQSGSGELYYPVFTDGQEMKKCGVEDDQLSIMINFDDLAAMLLQPQNKVAGFVVDPMGSNIIFTAEMVAAMKKEMEEKH